MVTLTYVGKITEVFKNINISFKINLVSYLLITKPNSAIMRYIKSHVYAATEHVLVRQEGH
jgi:hypothetical protein